jgi:hypothetical protein
MSQLSIDVVVLTNLLKSLVTKPEEVKITRQIDEMGVLLSIQVHPQDMGIVIGRNGAMATAIKTLMKAVGKANHMNLRIRFLEPDGSTRFVGRRTQPDSMRSGDLVSNNQESYTSDSNPSLEDDLKDFVLK